MKCGNYKIRFCERHGKYFVPEGKSFSCPQCKKELENKLEENDKTGK